MIFGTKITLWFFIGLTAQLIFFMRFFIQWIVTEKKRKSTIPISFWHLSILGSLGLLSYAIHIKDPIFMLGQSLGLLIYIRNLYFIYKPNKDNISRTDEGLIA